MGDPDSELETVVVRLANLELTITARVLPTGEASSISVGSSSGHVAPSGFGPAEFEDPHRFSSQLEEQAISALTPAACAAVTSSLSFLASFTNRLRGTGGDQGWGPAARIGRAFRAGVIARRQLDGLWQAGVSPAIPQRNCYYICPRGRDHDCAFWTSSYGVYFGAVRSLSEPNDFDPRSISHSFPSRAEAEAYAAGARVRWPAERRQ